MKSFFVVLRGPVFAAMLWASACAAHSEREQFLLLNTSAGAEPGAFEWAARFPGTNNSRVRVGVGRIFSYLQESPESVARDLRRFLKTAQEQNVPVVVQFDGEQWWNNRPDLWNWWDPSRPGFSESNRLNVEWTDWSPDHAIKIAWRNWGRQLRVLPPPNLMSPAYRAACHNEMRVLIPIIMDWQHALPARQKDLLVGIKLGWETSIGVNAWHYPNGNELLSQDAARDPATGLKADEVPSRGVAQIGYAAVKTAGIRREGAITEADLAEVARRHLEDLCKLAAELGVPRELLFTHVAGWKENELLYASGLNKFSCPGWSFYQHSADPRNDPGVKNALARTDAPYWAAAEWLFQGPREADPWHNALIATLKDPQCRYVCIYNWQGISGHKEILTGIEAAVADMNSGHIKPRTKDRE